MEKKYNKIAAILVVSSLIMSLIGATFAWKRWEAGDYDITGVTFDVLNGSNNLKTILDADSTTFSNMFFAENCNGTYAKMATINLYYQNTTGYDAVIDATLKLESISSIHSGDINTSAIKYAITSNTGSSCASSVISTGTLNGVVAGNTDNAIIYNGNLDTGIIPTNTNMGLKKTLYLYFWIDSEYEIINTGSGVVTNPLQDLSLKVVWSGTITTVPQESYTVTFDANGGTVPISSKTVIPGKTYGELPVPTKEGYTFLGWNGKNLLNLYDRTEGTLTGSYDTPIRTFDFNKYYVGATRNNFYAPSTVRNAKIVNNTWLIKSDYYGYGVGFPIQIQPNQAYSVSFNYDTIDDLSSQNGVGFYDIDGNYINNLYTTSGTYFRTPNNCYIMTFILGGVAGYDIFYSDIQLEEGDTATPYEPYYITSDTTVVQEKNHTLKAIWEPSS